MIEFLENRRLLSASVANGTLTITGTAKADHIDVLQRGTAIIVHEGSAVSRFSKKDHISKIIVNALGGNDNIKITSKIAATVDGGDGKDLIIGGSGADVLMGGNGNDRILGQGGSDSISGGAGKDALFGGAGDDTIDAFDAEADQLTGGAGNDSARVDSQTDTAWNIENYLSVDTNSSGAVTGVTTSSGTLTLNGNVNLAGNVTDAGSMSFVFLPGATIGATLEGNGTLSGGSVVNAGTLQLTGGTIPGNSTINLGNVNLNANGTLNLIAVSGFTAGTYRLITTSSFIDSGNVILISNNVPTAFSYSIIDTPANDSPQPAPEAPAADPIVIVSPEDPTLQDVPTDQPIPTDLDPAAPAA